MHTRRWIAVLTVSLGLLSTAGPIGRTPERSQAATPAPTAGVRTVSLSYTGPGAATSAVGGAPVALGRALSATVAPNEDRVAIASADDAGGWVGLVVEYTPRGPGARVSRVFCRPTFTLSVASRSTLLVRSLAGRCPDGRLSAPTTGTVTLAFHRVIPKPVMQVKPVSVPAAKRWALVVGISDYAGRTHDTYGGRGDVTAVRGSLLRAGWRADHIEVLLDRAASAAAITAALGRLAARSGPDTFTLVHYSGHMCIARRGPCPSGHTYLWGADNRFVSEQQVARSLRTVQGTAWFDFAGCQAGAFDVGLSSPRRLFSASSQWNETSYERKDWGRSVWTGLAWHEGFLRGQAANGRPYRATINQMVTYAKAQAPPMTRHGERGSQHPYVAGGGAGWTLWAPPVA